MVRTIEVYTDGATRNNQKKENVGAWGYILIYGKHVKEQAEVVKNTTNNIQELTAVIEALKAIKTKDKPVVVYTDSQYVHNGITEWIAKWRRNNWKSSTGSPIKNRDLWIELDSLVSTYTDIRFEKVKGHADDEFNNKVDALVNLAMDRVMYL